MALAIKRSASEKWIMFPFAVANNFHCTCALFSMTNSMNHNLLTTWIISPGVFFSISFQLECHNWIHRLKDVSALPFAILTEISPLITRLIEITTRTILIYSNVWIRLACVIIWSSINLWVHSEFDSNCLNRMHMCAVCLHVCRLFSLIQIRTVHQEIQIHY